jgi:hypothetical protein
MVYGFVVVGLVVVQVVIAENMNFVVDSTGIIDKERVVVGIGIVGSCCHWCQWFD